MKSKSIKIYFLAAGLVIFTLTSCLKSSDNYIDFSKVGTLIELPLAAYRPTTHTPSLTVYKIAVQTYAAASTPSDLPVVVNIASPEPLGSDLTVTLAADPAALADLKTKIGNTSYILLPAAGYTITNPTTTIIAGKRTGTVTVKINTAVIDKTITTYILPISITDASGQAISKYKTVFYNIKVTS
jgi:hypothetical protein